MHFTKLNLTFDAEPNAPEPLVSVIGSELTVKFRLNWMIWDDVHKDDEAALTFYDAYIMYRLGSTNDEGFYKGQCRFSKSGIQWGDFYELLDSGWQHAFPSDGIIISPSLKGAVDLKHFLFYFRDETFECIARRFSFRRVEKRTLM